MRSTHRQELEAKVLWSEECGYSICAVAEMMFDALDHPGPGRLDWPSVVSVTIPREKYSDEELEKIVKFAEEATARYDKLFRYRRGMNLIIFDKEEPNRWLRKRKSWYMGLMYSPSLDEALAFMRKIDEHMEEEAHELSAHDDPAGRRPEPDL